MGMWTHGTHTYRDFPWARAGCWTSLKSWPFDKEIQACPPTHSNGLRDLNSVASASGVFLSN